MNDKLLCGCEQLAELFKYFEAWEILLLNHGSRTQLHSPKYNDY